MKFKRIEPTLILLTILAATLAATPVSSQDAQRGPETDVLRFMTIRGGLPQPPPEYFYADGYIGGSESGDWTNPGALVGMPDGVYSESVIAGSTTGYYTFENITLAGREIANIDLEGYTRQPDDVANDFDPYVFVFDDEGNNLGWAWCDSLGGSSDWAWTGGRYYMGTEYDMPEYYSGKTYPDDFLHTEEGFNNMQLSIENYGASGPRMQIDALRWKVEFVPDPEQPSVPVVAMQECIIDVVTDLIRTVDVEKLDEECHTITRDIGFHIAYIGFNIRPDQSYRRDVTYWPLADADFRHALIHSYDQLGIIPSIYGYIVVPVQSLVPPAQSQYHNPAVPTHPFDPGLDLDPGSPDYMKLTFAEGSSTGILVAAGYEFVDNDADGIADPDDYWKMPNGDPLPRMVIWSPLNEEAPTSYQHVAEFVADLADVGLAATAANGYHGLVNIGRDFSEYLDDVYDADFDAFMVAHGLGRLPGQLYSLLHSSQDSLLYPGGSNAPGVDDPTIDDLTEIVRFSLYPYDIANAAKEIQARLYGPTLPNADKFALSYMTLYSRSYINAFKSCLAGIIKSPGYGSNNMWTFLNMHWTPGNPNERIEDGKSTIIWCINDEPETLNPLHAGTYSEWEILTRLYDGLTAMNPYNHIDIPWLATDWTITETADGMKIDFTLRDDIYWHDGYRFTAFDVEFCLELLRDYQVPRYAETWETLMDVIVTDDTHCTVVADKAGLDLFYDYTCLATMLPPQIYDRPWGTGGLPPITGYRPDEKAYGTDMAPGYAPGPWASDVPTNLFGIGPFVFRFYNEANEYSDMWANRNYFMTTAEIDDLKTEMFWEVGDVNRDGVVDEFDLERIDAAFGSTPGDPNWDGDCDLDSNSFINIQDLNEAAYHLTWTREARKAICYTSVIVDVKPGSWPNPIDLRDKGMLTVAILGTEEFDVTTVNPETIRLTREGLETEIGVEPVRWGYEDLKKRDGYLDLTLQFEAQEVITMLELDQFVDQTIPLIITGYLKEEYGSTPIRGQDCVWILDG